MQKRQIDKKQTKQIRIDKDLHQALKVEAAKGKTTLNKLIDAAAEQWLHLIVDDIHSRKSGGK